MNPARPEPGTRLCALADIPDPGSRGFRYAEGSSRFAGFVVRRGQAVFGYVDRCPHAGWPISSIQDQHLTREGDLILCTGHAALFRIEDGLCVAGPCADQRLEPWPIEQVDGQVRVAAA